MKAKILNVYNNNVLPEAGLQASHGAAFVISIGNDHVLLDTGWKPEILLANMARLRVDLDQLGQLVISHGHIDHTGGLAGLLSARKSKACLPVIAHPLALEPKALKTGENFAPLGFPEVSPELLAKVDFRLSRDPQEILPGLVTLGEIPLQQRTEKPGAEPNAFHKVNDHWEWDPILDDLSLVLKTEQGLVIITGCCHAGLLNTCAAAARLWRKNIHAVIGGTHMVRYSEEEVEEAGQSLARGYGPPLLFLNHCTGPKAVEQLRKQLGPKMVHDFPAGAELTFDVS
jgi:7,8-dihydropterin-6-yl-methyl-4-(beta-D-ribofuranosyl)aminobenzene 5'-phosphate synthase